MNEKNALGIVGGVGSSATVLLFEKIIKMTKADSDQSHINMIILNHAAIPDRTQYILNSSNQSPLPCLMDDVIQLEKMGVENIIIPCNTAHFFYEKLVTNLKKASIINMIDETIDYVRRKKIKKVGLLATTGTLHTFLYQEKLSSYGIDSIVPDDTFQKLLMDIIYNYIKSGQEYDKKSFFEIVDFLKAKNCECIILACTELSIIKKNENLDDFYVDSLDILAIKAIKASGKEIK